MGLTKQKAPCSSGPWSTHYTHDLCETHSSVVRLVVAFRASRDRYYDLSFGAINLDGCWEFFKLISSNHQFPISRCFEQTPSCSLVRILQMIEFFSCKVRSICATHIEFVKWNHAVMPVVNCTRNPALNTVYI